MTAVSTQPNSPPSSAGSALDDALVAALDRLSLRYVRVLRRALIDVDGQDRLTLPQLRCLQTMARADGPSLTTKLARSLQVTTPTMTRTIDGLVERGLVARQPDPASRRQIALVITPAGRELLARYERIIADRLGSLLAPLDDDAKRRLLAVSGELAALLADGAPESGTAD